MRLIPFVHRTVEPGMKIPSSPWRCQYSIGRDFGRGLERWTFMVELARPKQEDKIMRAFNNLVAFVLILAIAVLIGFPVWINSPPVRDAFTGWLNEEIGIECTFERITGYPWSAMGLRGVSASAAEAPGTPGFDFKGDISVKVNLSSLAAGEIGTDRLDLSKVKIKAKLPVEPPDGVEDRGLHKTYDLELPKPVRMELSDGTLKTTGRVQFLVEGNEFWTEGSVDMESLQLNFDFGGDEVDQRFIAKVQENPYSEASMPLPDSLFEVEGNLSGPMDNPSVSGTFASKEIDSQGFWPESVQGNFAYASEVTDVDELKINMWDGELNGRFKLDDRGDRDLYELELSGASVRIGPLLDRFALEAGLDIPLKLGLNGSISFNGSLKDPLNSRGTMSFNSAGGEAEFGGNELDLDNLALNFRMGGKELRLTSGQLSSDMLNVSAGGVVRFNGSSPGMPGIEFKDLNIFVDGEDIGSLIPEGHPLKQSVSGKAEGTLSVNGGTAARPLTIDVDGTLSDGKLYRVSLLDVDMDLDYHSIRMVGRSSTRAMEIERFDVESPAGRVKLTGDAEYAGRLDLTGRAVLNGNYLSLHPDLKSKLPAGLTTEVGGFKLKIPELEADLDVSGTMANPRFNWGKLVGATLQNQLRDELNDRGSDALDNLINLFGN